MTSIEKHTQIVKNTARTEGFDFVGISTADFLEKEAHDLEKWLQNGHHGKMHYMENHFDKRLDPRKLVDGAQSVVSLLYNYYTEEEQKDPEAPKISKYAYGKDYHFVVKDKMKSLMQKLTDQIGEINGRIFVDSAPVMDKVWAKKSGLGWQGKHTNLINKSQGSFFFIAELIIDLKLIPDGPIQDYCGTCTKCLDACPTDALYEPYKIDASKCISYLTIELKDEIIPQEFKGKMDNWMFGCDICQDVCPWNRFSKKHSEPEFEPQAKLLGLNSYEWKELTEEIFQELFKKSPVKRTKMSGLKRNIKFVSD